MNKQSMRLPDWIRVRNIGNLHDTKQILKKHGISTVCDEARCPNRGACFARPTATFMILGTSCTRSCGFCSVRHAAPLPADSKEPDSVAQAAEALGLRYIVITSVTRDDLADGGSSHFAATITAVRKRLPRARIEVLTPDFEGNHDSLRKVLEAQPDVFNHNIETVGRFYPVVRPEADYVRSLLVLKNARAMAPAIHIKSGFMLGLGETFEETLSLLVDLRQSGVNIVTIGQYLRPTIKNLPVVEYIRPEVFEKLKTRALAMGFAYVASGPLVRSSMNAEEMYGHV